MPWPAISDIYLGVRTVPVLSVAKELVALPARSHRAADHPNTGRAKRTDRSTIDYEEILSFVCLLMFPSLLEVITGRELPRVLKADVLCKCEKSAWFPSSEIDDRSWLLSVIVRVLRGRVRLGKGEK